MYVKQFKDKDIKARRQVRGRVLLETEEYASPTKISIISYNVRGLNNDTRKLDLYKLTRYHLLSIYGILENKFNNANLSFFMEALGQEWEYTHNKKFGQRGRILLME